MTNAQHIIITGAMGVGKTTIGRLLAEELGLPFQDSDLALEARAREQGVDIARRDGVTRLHELELEVFLDMCRASTRSVLSPASSVVDHETGREAMEGHFVVWLTAPDEIVAGRQETGDHRRPVDAEQRAELRARRAPHLETLSDLVVDTGTGTPADVVARVVAGLPDR